MTEYLYKFACFDCNVAFKRRATGDDSTNSAHKAESDIAHACPNCGHRMAFMGRNFSAPSKQDADAWGAAKALWEAGFRFSGSGFHSGPPLPKSKNEVRSFVLQNQNHAQKIGTEQRWENYA